MITRRVLHGSWAISALAVVMTTGGCQLLPEIFNEDRFLAAVNVATGPQNQGTPAVDDLILIKFTNETSNLVMIKVRILRPSGTETIGWDLAGRATVGQILKQCQSDPPTLIRMKFLGEDEPLGEGLPEQVTFPDAFVWVDNIPTLVNSAPRPLQLGPDFACGDTIEFIVRATAADKKKFEIVAAIFRTDPADVQPLPDVGG